MMNVCLKIICMHRPKLRHHFIVFFFFFFYSLYKVICGQARGRRASAGGVGDQEETWGDTKLNECDLCRGK